MRIKRPKLPPIFRWKYIAPRLAIVIAVVLAVRYGLDPALRWGIVVSGEAAIGAKVEVANLTTSLRGGTLTVDGVAVANPSKPMRNLLESSQVRLEIDGAQLLRKRVVVHNGRIDGIKFDGERTTSGALEILPETPAEPSALDPMFTAAQETAAGWFDDLTGRMEQDLLGSLATPQVAEELKRRWPEQYQALRKRADDLRAKAKQIETAFRDAKKNPLRGMQQVEELRKQLTQTQAELQATLAEIKALPEQAKADRLALDAARKQDQAFLKEHLKLSGIDPDGLNRYLLGETASGYLEQTTWWIEQVRKFVPKNRVAAPTRSRGTNVVFAGRRQPKMLLERIELAGEARLDGQPLAFTGLLSDVASEPELHERPLQLAIHSSGAVDGVLLVELDRRGEMAHDSIKIDVPQLNLAHRTLGRADKLAVTVAPGAASLKADIRLDGDELVGTIELKQSSTLAAQTPALRDDRIAAVIQESLSGVDRLEAKIELAGTLKRPSIRIESNVGPQLAAGVSGAVKKYLTDRKDRIMAKVQGEVDEQLAKLQAERDKAQQELMAALGENQQMVTQLASVMGGGEVPLQVDVAKLGKAIDLNKLKR
ncbi:TIGR03545 family protein [Lacipirellula sp.]|uniref:TIGR03545 family protein n=1 Tax=Lacipirellula sp. TaxID=2691419 RepID=UPI003D0E1287